jgi:hypothetical protein
MIQIPKPLDNKATIIHKITLSFFRDIKYLDLVLSLGTLKWSKIESTHASYFFLSLMFQTHTLNIALIYYYAQTIFIKPKIYLQNYYKIFH